MCNFIIKIEILIVTRFHEKVFNLKMINIIIIFVVSIIPFCYAISFNTLAIKLLSNEFPKTLDWRNVNGTNYVAPAHNQGSCGACWTFSTVAVVESAIAIQKKKIIKLSEQQLLDCCTECSYDGADRCSGGIREKAFEYMQNYGISASVTYGKYVSSQQPCKNTNVTARVTIFSEIYGERIISGSRLIR